jgi:hypothetical protein
MRQVKPAEHTEKTLFKCFEWRQQHRVLGVYLVHYIGNKGAILDKACVLIT